MGHGTSQCCFRSSCESIILKVKVKGEKGFLCKKTHLSSSLEAGQAE